MSSIPPLQLSLQGESAVALRSWNVVDAFKVLKMHEDARGCTRMHEDVQGCSLVGAF